MQVKLSGVQQTLDAQQIPLQDIRRQGTETVDVRETEKKIKRGDEEADRDRAEREREME